MRQDINKMGLTQLAADKLHSEGMGNVQAEKVTKSTSDIMKDNVFTLFNAFNFTIALFLILVGAYSNLLFIFIIILNITIGIFQELHAKKLVENLSLVIEPQVEVLRDGTLVELPTHELVVGDVFVLKLGQQVPVDAILVSGQVEANESLLTGEAESIVKKEEMKLLSGSYIVSGSCYAKATKVGAESFANRIVAEAKSHKRVFSEFKDSMDKVTKFTSYLIIPLGIVLFFEAYVLRKSSIDISVITTAAALLGMLPKGLLLFISLALASGVIKLAKKNVLVQEMHVLEALAHVDVLCLDKTGTITEGKMKVSEVVSDYAGIDALTKDFLGALSDANATFDALSDHFGKNEAIEAEMIVPFSSSRKWSATSFDGVHSYILGAPEVVLSHSLDASLNQKMVDGGRVLVFVKANLVVDEKTVISKLPVETLAYFVLEDPIRENAKATLDYFAQEGVQLKVISGDNPVTVSSVAQKAGLEGYDKYIDLSQITDSSTVKGLVDTYTIFGRVTPNQKKWIVEALKEKGHTVAMTGDGVNDVPALKASDCSIAIAEGSDAAKQVAQLVLLDSDFAILPEILGEGRRVVNNVTNAASIFFIKTIYSVILSIICILTNIPFPFAPIQITLIDLAIEGYPSFFMSFENNHKKVTGEFLPNVLKRSIPGAVTIIVHLVGMALIGKVMNLSQVQLVTSMYYMIAFVTILTALRVLKPYNIWKLFLAVTMTGGFYVATLLFARLLHIEFLQLPALILFGGSLVTSFLLNRLLRKVFDRIDLEKYLNV